MQNASPRFHLLNAKRMSKQLASEFSSLSSASFVKPLSLSAAWLTPGAPASVPWPTA